VRVSPHIQTLTGQQRTYTSGALHTWQIYHNIQNNILQNIELGNIAQAQNTAHLQGEPAFTDALSALHSLIQFNEKLSTWVDKGANDETQQQLIDAFLGSFLAFLGVLLICVFVSYSLVRRLKHLHQVTRAVEQGQTDARVSVIGRDEAAKGASLESPYVCICVRDTVPGIPPEEQSMLFQQFFRLKRDLSGTIRGTGLGLYLCRQFVEAMNGQIWVESSGIAGEGSSFCFTLPVAPSAS
jgi:nitrogen fixation/metabolism regulation signal transduction histidine kinase